MSSVAVSSQLVPPGYCSTAASGNPPPHHHPMTTKTTISPPPQPSAPILPASTEPEAATGGAAPAASASTAASAASSAAGAASNKPATGKTVVYLGATRAKRKPSDYMWPCKRQKTALAFIVLPVGHHTAPPPPVRTAPAPYVVTLDAAGANKAAARSLKALDAEQQQQGGGSGANAGGNKAISQLAGAASAAAATTTPLAASSSSSLRGPPTAAGSMHGSASASAGGEGGGKPTTLGSTRKSTSAAAAAIAAEQSRREEEAARAASVVTPDMEAAVAKLERRVAGLGYLGMAELLPFLLHARVRLLDHAALLAAVQAALAAKPQLRKAFCDFEAAMAGGDASQHVYGKRPGPVFAELVQGEGGPVEVYDEHVFLRLFMVFVATRLQMVQGWQMAEEAGGKEGKEEEVAFVTNVLLKPWVARAYDYI